MNEIFQSVYEFLKWISRISGLTYHEVNIIGYFFIVPSIFVILAARLFKSKILLIGYGILLISIIILIPNFKLFSTIVFEKSVDFLNWFDKIGLDYIQASVVICVVIPLLIIAFLLFLNKKRKMN